MKILKDQYSQYNEDSNEKLPHTFLYYKKNKHGDVSYGIGHGIYTSSISLSLPDEIEYGDSLLRFCDRNMGEFVTINLLSDEFGFVEMENLIEY